MAEKKLPDYIKLTDGGADITLATPIDLDGAKVTVIRMREPTVNDQLAIDDMKGGQAKKEIQFFANLTEHAPDTISSMTLRNYTRLQRALQAFID